MASSDGSDLDSLSSSVSSDDDFLTMTGDPKGGTPDREAIIRRKLLESFYGSSVPEQHQQPGNTVEAEPEDQKIAATSAPNQINYGNDDFDNEDGPSSDRGASDDLDSPYFDAEAHTSRHVKSSSMHTLLETEERLALQVRTLDSTMQTLVYDNYSSFIDATEAIKSIGVSVNANEEGLGRLSNGMKTIDKQTREVEDQLGALRDAVAEKVRVKRLLTRLDSLLKLPTTLRQQIGNGNYRLATKSYLSAHSILSKHSVGFESLKTIETECHDILTLMVKTLRHKLVHWSSHSSLLMDVDGVASEQDQDWLHPAVPPKTMSEIFECAGTIFLLLPNDDDKDIGRITFDSGFTSDACKSMALSAAIRLLERVLDAHQIELQDAMFSQPSFDEDTYEAKLNRIPLNHEADAHAAPKGSSLIPTAYLDNVLEAATLFSLSFGNGRSSTLSDDDQMLLTNFVSEVYSGFLAHVKSVLLDQSPQSEPMESENTDNMGVEDEDGDTAYGEVSGAMTHLLRSVRDLASGLALPEVGVDVEFAAGLVDQAVEVTEAMVRRRVAEKFFSLRQSVVQDCFEPFVREAIALPADNEARVVDIVQMASVALSDGLQLVDDTIRSILSGDGLVSSSGKEVQIEMIKDAVQASSRHFAVWLASALEQVAGCESSDSKLVVDADEKAQELDEDKDDSQQDEMSVPSQVAPKTDDMSDISVHHESLKRKVESCLQDVLALLDDAPVEAVLDLTLATAEMCRLAEKSVMENIRNSIASSMEGDRKAHKSSHLFPSSEHPGRKRGKADKDKDISDRFHLAASRVLTLYALNRGSSAAVVFCARLFETACDEGCNIPNSPRVAACEALAVVKFSSLDCARIFGGDQRAGPVPDFPEDDGDYSYLSPVIRSGKPLGGRLGAVKGLQLDVERMFSGKMSIYPHPSTVLDFSRDTVVTMVMKVAMRAIVEVVRSSTFSAQGYRQLQVDVALLRHMIPHYINEDFVVAEGTKACVVVENLLDDIMSNAGDRCADAGCVGNEELRDSYGATDTPLGIVRQFMSQDDIATQCIRKRFVIEVGNME